MPILKNLIKVFKASSIKVTWTFIYCLVLGHMLTAWAMMAWAGEELASTFSTWTYFYVVTVSTTGYGDYSPTTNAGQWVTILYLIPGGISLFAALIGKASVSINQAWKERVQGMNNYRGIQGHTLILGWHGETTEKIIDLLKADTNLPDEIVLCVTKEMSNPRPGQIKFVKGESFASEELLKRAGVEGASRIIIYDECDEKVANVALSAYHLKHPGGHIVAHCENPHTASMLRRALPGIETTETQALQMLVRSATDAGISRVVNELLAVDRGATQYQATLTGVPDGTTFGELFFRAKGAFNATVLGVASVGQEDDVLNTMNDRTLSDGDTIFYMADSRLTNEQIAHIFNTKQPFYSQPPNVQETAPSAA